MNRCEVFIESYTHAMKAQRLLANAGWKSTIRRHTGEEGCGYILSTGADCRSLSDILEIHGIAGRPVREHRRDR